MKTSITQNKSELLHSETEKLLTISDNNLKQLQSIFQNSPAAIAIFNGSEHRFIMANLKYQKQNNRAENDLLGKTFQEVFPELNGTGSYEIFDTVFKTGETYTSSEYPAMIDLQNNGIAELCYFNFSLEALKNESYEIYGLMVMSLDITEQVLARKKIEENDLEIRKIKEHLELSIKAGKIGIWSWDAEKDNLYWNDEQKEIYGIEKLEELNNLKQFQSFVIPEDWERIILNIQGENIKLNQEYNFRIIRKSDGEIRWIKSKSKVLLDDIGNIKFISGVNIDITEQEKAHKKIEDSENQMQSLFMQSPFALAYHEGKDFRLTIINENALQTIGKTLDEVIGKSPEEVVPNAKEQGFIVLLEQVYNTNIAFEAKEMPMTNVRNGVQHHSWWDFTYTPISNKNGEVQGIISVGIEVTDKFLARKKIEESEHKYENLIFTSPYMIAIFKGKNLIIEIANNAILETWGKGKDVIGKSFFDVLPEAVEQGFDKLILKVFETGEPYHAYETPITLWRNERWELMHYNFIYQAQRNVKGEIEGVAILANEVSPHVLDKMRIIESEERFRLLADNLPLSVFIAAPTLEANVIYLNKYWLEFTKQTFEEAIGMGWHNIVHPDDVHLIMDVYLDAYAKQIPYSTPNIRIKRHDGVYRWFTFHGNPRFLNNGEFVGMIGAGFDITEQKLFELELIEEKIKADNAVQAKQQFLSNMSHEIRTPMNAIVGFTNVILKTNLNDSQKQYLDAIKVSGDALVVLINDILDLAKVDSGKMTFENTPFDLAECIHKIALLFEHKLKEKKLKFNLNLDDTIPNQITGDWMRLRQIILNLLSNAVKFTDKGSISLDVKVVSHSKNKINIDFKIIDTGIGIENDKLEAIFNNFEQAHSETSANYGGTGLGLAIVKKLVENQGGTITTTSEVDKGSTFSFNLQFETNISQHILPKKNTENSMICQSETQLKNIKILVAEDVALNQLLIKIILGNFNFEVDIVENGQIAIEKIKTNTYDLILMDLHMPEINGFEATKYIREEMKSQIPIIALTADVTQADIDKCLAVGMQDYLSKPIDEAILYEKIVKVLNEKHK
jgi:PAS domain S-box-containing protein